jgi:hypothetical protein
MMCARSNQRLYIWLKLQKKCITNSEDVFRASFIILMLHVYANSLQMLAEKLLHEMAFLEPKLEIWCRTCVVSSDA